MGFSVLRIWSIFGSLSGSGFALKVAEEVRSPDEVRGLIFAGYVPLASQNFYPIVVYSMINYRLHLSHFWQICNFRDHNLFAFYLSMYLILKKKTLHFHPQSKHSGTFASRKYEELSYPTNHSSNSIGNGTP